MMSKHIFQKEPVLSIATCLAIISAFFVPPDAEYLGYIDFRTLAILFSLMAVMAGLRGQSVFDRLGHALLSHTRTTLQLTVVLVGLCFFSSMLITNDVSLLTFVPFTFVVLNRLNASVRSKLLLPIVCMQTIAANLGSMLTPLGNPQNLYLYGKSGMDMSSFVLLMLPYSIISLVLIAIWAVWLCREGSDIVVTHCVVRYSVCCLFIGCIACSPIRCCICRHLGVHLLCRPPHFWPRRLFSDSYLCSTVHFHRELRSDRSVLWMVAEYSGRP